jgi:hypothetical protein
MLLAGVLNIIANILYKSVVWLTKPCNDYIDYLEQNDEDNG